MISFFPASIPPWPLITYLLSTMWPLTACSLLKASVRMLFPLPYFCIHRVITKVLWELLYALSTLETLNVFQACTSISWKLHTVPLRIHILQEIFSTWSSLCVCCLPSHALSTLSPLHILILNFLIPCWYWREAQSSLQRFLLSLFPPAGSTVTQLVPELHPASGSKQAVGLQAELSCPDTYISAE